MKLTGLLSGTRIIEEVRSNYNGDIKVMRDFTWGTYITAGGLTQSGGIVEKIWRETLKKVLENKPVLHNVLILGLGGGSVARLISQYWVTAKITGVDIDPKVVELGEKYLGLDELDIDIQIEDAQKFLIRNLKFGKRYDLILVDLYNGDKFPVEFEKEEFINNLKKLANTSGIVIFNRLYGGIQRPESMKFGRELEKFFRHVDYVYPQANLDLICYN